MKDAKKLENTQSGTCVYRSILPEVFPEVFSEKFPKIQNTTPVTTSFFNKVLGLGLVLQVY